MSGASSAISNDLRLVVSNSPMDGLEEEISYVRGSAIYQQGMKSGSVNVSDSIGRSEIDAKIAASEARTETKIVRLEGKIDALIGLSTTISSHQDANASSLKTNIWAATAIIITTFIGLFAIAVTLGPTAFSFGTQLRDLVRTEVHSEVGPKPPI